MADENKKEVTEETAETAKKDIKKEKPAKPAKAAKQPKPKKDGNIFVRAGRRIKKFFKDEKGECKKVVWPSGKTVLKSSGVVLLVVAVTSAVIYGFDQGLSQLLKLLIDLAGKSDTTTTTAVASMITAFFGF